MTNMAISELLFYLKLCRRVNLCQNKMHSLIFIYIHILSYKNVSTPLLKWLLQTRKLSGHVYMSLEFSLFQRFFDSMLELFRQCSILYLQFIYHYLYIPLMVACFIVRVHIYHRLQIDHSGLVRFFSLIYNYMCNDIRLLRSL